MQVMPDPDMLVTVGGKVHNRYLKTIDRRALFLVLREMWGDSDNNRQLGPVIGLSSLVVDDGYWAGCSTEYLAAHLGMCGCLCCGLWAAHNPIQSAIEERRARKTPLGIACPRVGTMKFVNATLVGSWQE